MQDSGSWSEVLASLGFQVEDRGGTTMRTESRQKAWLPFSQTGSDEGKEKLVRRRREHRGYTSSTGVRVSSDMGMAALTRTLLSEMGMVGHPAPTAHFQSPDLAIVRTFHEHWPRLHLFEDFLRSPRVGLFLHT